MWAFFSRRLRMWLILALGAPLAVKLLRRTAETIEQRRGATSLTRRLHSTSDWIDTKRSRRSRSRARRP